ncbi:unnamed protein product, partial [Prorocentrum cordatum]
VLRESEEGGHALRPARPARGVRLARLPPAVPRQEGRAAVPGEQRRADPRLLRREHHAPPGVPPVPEVVPRGRQGDEGGLPDRRAPRPGARGHRPRLRAAYRVRQEERRGGDGRYARHQPEGERLRHAGLVSRSRSQLVFLRPPPLSSSQRPPGSRSVALAARGRGRG